jgi:hypothetical protein
MFSYLILGIVVWMVSFMPGSMTGTDGHTGRGAGKTELKLKLKKGMSFRQRVYIEQTTSQISRGKRSEGQKDKKVQTYYETTIDYTFLVEDVDARGTAVVKVSYDSIQVVRDDSEKRDVFNSTLPSTFDSPLAYPYSAMIGSGFRVRIDPSGEVRDIMGVEELQSYVLSRFRPADSARRETIIGSLNQLFSAESLKDVVLQLMPPYPPSSVSVGDTWQRTILVGGKVPMTLKAEYKLARRDADKVVIEEDATIGNNNSVRLVDSAGFQISYDIKGSRKGTIEIDPETGWMMGRSFTREFTGRMQVFMQATATLVYESPLTDDSYFRTKAWKE